MGVVWAFVAITPILALVSASTIIQQSSIFGDTNMCQAWVAAFFLGNVKLGRGSGPDEEGSQNIVIEGSYLLTVMRGERGSDGEVKGIRLESPDGETSLVDGSPHLADGQRINRA